jgi:hypothetical protein
MSQLLTLRGILRPPAEGASKEERLRFIRRCSLIQFPGAVAVWILVLVVGMPTWALIVLGVATATGLGSVVSLTWRIRRLSKP